MNGSAWCRRALASAFSGGLALAVVAAVQAAPPADAQSLLSAAVGVAGSASEKKVVLVEFGASWCGTCRTFEVFLQAPGIRETMSDNYVVVKLNVQESDESKGLQNPGAEELLATWGGTDAGLPFYVFVDAEGKKVADSRVMPKGRNVGFPNSHQEADAFVALLERTAPRMNADQRGAVVEYPAKQVKK